MNGNWVHPVVLADGARVWGRYPGIDAEQDGVSVIRRSISCAAGAHIYSNFPTNMDRYSWQDGSIDLSGATGVLLLLGPKSAKATSIFGESVIWRNIPVTGPVRGRSWDYSQN